MPREKRVANGFSVLVVDDNPGIRTLVKTILELGGYMAVAATDGGVALAFLSAGLRFDAAVIDLRMPGLAGPALGTALQTAQPGLRIVYMSGQDTFGEAEVPQGEVYVSKLALVIDLPVALRNLLADEPVEDHSARDRSRSCSATAT